jgi:hypothetical protein
MANRTKSTIDHLLQQKNEMISVFGDKDKPPDA